MVIQPHKSKEAVGNWQLHLCILLLLLFLTSNVHSSYNPDQKLFLKINGCRNIFFNGASRVLSDVVYIPQILYFYSLGYGYFNEDEHAFEFGTIGAAATFSTILITQLAKSLIKRERPIFALKGVKGGYAHGFFAWLIPTEKYSCPSQSASFAASEAIILGYSFPRYDRYFFTLMVLNGWARIYRGAHYPTDVLMGFLVGGVTTYTSLYFLKKLDPDLDIKKSRARVPIFRIGRSF